MYVCICNGITEKDIEEAIVKHSSTKDILKSLGVGTDCGVCMVEAIEKLKLSVSNQTISGQVQQNPK